MERIRLGGRIYTDPDVLSLIRSRATPVDPRIEVLRRAKELNQKLRNYGVVENPRQRLEILASLAGIKVAPMLPQNGLAASRRDGLLYLDRDGGRQAYYDSENSEGRANFSIAHEIVHTFFPNSIRGARFRTLHEDSSKEAKELEQLCNLGASELLMPEEEFLEFLGDELGLHVVPRLCERFGSSFEATVYRLATAYQGIAVAGLLRYRLRLSEERATRVSTQQALFEFRIPNVKQPTPKYRRQSFYTSPSCGDEHVIRWNKSFDEGSCVYRAGVEGQIEYGCENLPNQSDQMGHIEAVQAPYQRPEAHPAFGDVLFLWWR